MNDANVVEVLKQFFRREVLEGSEVGLDGTTPLLELGLLNSMSVLLLLNDIEQKLGVLISRDEVNPENLKDIDAIVRMVERARSAPPAK
jgi:acyl carrier protein